MMRVLVIGLGAVGYEVVKWLVKFTDARITVSLEEQPRDEYIKIDDSRTLLRSSSKFGLGAHWHGVQDITYLKNNNLNVDKRFEIANGEPANYEFVPWFIERPRKFASIDFIREIKEIIPLDSGVKVRTIDDGEKTFDFLFVCHGAVPRSDVLVASGLANEHNYISDHLIISDHKVVPKERFDLSYNQLGVIRKYSILDTQIGKIKKTLRPIYFRRKPITFVEKNIYSDKKILKKMIQLGDLNLILQASNLRFGFPDFVGRATQFYQLPGEDILFRENNKIYYDSKKIEVIRECVSDNLSIESFDISSGIHFSNSLSWVDEDYISNFESCDKRRIFLFTPQYKFMRTPHHFTQFMIQRAKVILGEVFSEYSNHSQ
jgi:hypothetical protein